MNTTSYIVGGIFLVLVIYVINSNLVIRKMIRNGRNYSFGLWEYGPFRRYVSTSYVSEVWPSEGQNVQTFKDWWAFRIITGMAAGLFSFVALVLFIEHFKEIMLRILMVKSFILEVTYSFAFIAVIPCLTVLIEMSVRSVTWGLAALRYDPEREVTLS